MVLRDPLSRAISAFFEVNMHYLAILRLPPALLRTCARAADYWPMDMDITDDPQLWEPTGPYPEICRETWTRNPYTKALSTEGEDGSIATRHAIVIDRQTMLATAESAQLRALWQLPDGCRQIGRELNFGRRLNDPFTNARERNRTSVTWWCDEDACYEPCEIPDNTLATIFGHALSDAAKQNMIGCNDQQFGGEHMWPQFMHIARAGRADAVLRLETIEEDSRHFEDYLQHTLGQTLPPARDDCSITSTHVNQGTVIEPALSNTTLLNDIVLRSPALQRRICALYYHDFVCGSYELLEACKAPVATWLNQTMHELLNDAPLQDLEHHDSHSVRERKKTWHHRLAGRHDLYGQGFSGL